MKLRDAVKLVRTKLGEEIDGEPFGPATHEYERCVVAYPASMQVAHVILAIEVARGRPVVDDDPGVS